MSAEYLNNLMHREKIKMGERMKILMSIFKAFAI